VSANPKRDRSAHIARLLYAGVAGWRRKEPRQRGKATPIAEKAEAETGEGLTKKEEKKRGSHDLDPLSGPHSRTVSRVHGAAYREVQASGVFSVVRCSALRGRSER